MTRVPLYLLIYNAIKKDIKERYYVPGDLLPAETELEKKFAASRTTVRHAIERLKGEGYVKVEQGRGTAVLNSLTTQKLNCVTSITETLKAKGYVVTTRGMHIERIKATDRLSAVLGVKDDAQVFRIQRIQCADRFPIAIMTNYLEAGMVPDIDKFTGTFTSLYAFLEEHYNVVLTDAVETISAAAATFMESQVLQVPVGTPLLLSERVSNTIRGPFEYCVAKLVAEKYEYSVYLSGRK
jgi:GntR family transcriptional regulator